VLTNVGKVSGCFHHRIHVSWIDHPVLEADEQKSPQKDVEKVVSTDPCRVEVSD